MHKRIMKLLTGSDKTLHITDHITECEYIATSEPVVPQLKIFGNTDESLSGIGVWDSTFENYIIKLTIRNENAFATKDWQTMFKKNLSTCISFGTKNLATYTPKNSNDRSWISASDFEFKPNTVYTIRFKFIGAVDNQSTSFAFEYTDGSLDEIYGTLASGCIAGASSAEGKTVARIKCTTADGNKCKLYLDTLGLYEGVVDINEFIPYYGGALSIYSQRLLASGTIDGRTVRDYVDFKNRKAVHFFLNTMIQPYELEQHDIREYYSVSRWELPVPIDMENYSLEVSDFTYVNTLEEMTYTEKSYTLSEDGKYLYLINRPTNGHNGMQNYLYSNKVFVQYNLKEPFCEDIIVTNHTLPPCGYIKIKATANQTCSFRLYRSEWEEL